MMHQGNRHGSSKNYALKMQSFDGQGMMMERGTTADLEGSGS
jgi:hypothetical protein